MSRIRSDQLLLPSVLDRLIDHEPDNRRELAKDRGQLLQELKGSVRRDLENLLNTRVPFVSIPNDLPQLKKSLFNYGVPDFNRLVVESSDALEWMRKQIEECILSFETRFQSVRVLIDPQSRSKDPRFIRFIIDGVLYAEPAPEPVRFSSQLSAVSKEFQVKDDRS
jgi:type VI secretion system protein ImpF